MARLYANENFALPIVEFLRGLGHDVLTVVETGKAEQSWPDPQVLAFACGDRRAVLTFNRKHFKRLHSEQPSYCGIIVCTFDHDFEALARRIHAAIAAEADLGGKLLRINRPPA
jgi:hypothetical protein